MAKKDYKEIKEQLETPEPSLEEAVANLEAQFIEYNEKAKYYTDRALMARGAIDVLQQLINNKK